MEISESLHQRAVTSLWIGEEDHWRSTLIVQPERNIYRLYHHGRRVSQLLVLWVLLLGAPNGQLSNACGDTTCVNPYHYRDQSDRNELAWKMAVQQVNIMEELCNRGLSLDECKQFGIRIIDINGLAPSEILDQYGMTNDFGCYKCGKRFDPESSRNKVICDGCWTDEDEEKANAD